MKEQQDQLDSMDILKMLQQKIGNLELTVHAMMNVLEKEDLLDQEVIDEEAQEIVKEMQDVSEDEIEEEVKKRVNRE